MKSVFGEAAYPVFAAVGKSFISNYVPLVFDSLKGKKSVIKTLYGLCQAA
jgi:hypothetical protein